MNKHSKSLVLAMGIAFISAGSNFLQAQRSSSARSRATKSSTAQAQPRYETIRARAGESLSAIAERAGVSLDELARLNNLSLKSKLRRGQSLLIPPEANSQSQDTPPDEGLPNGKLIKFVDGGTLHVENAWWKGEDVWYT